MRAPVVAFALLFACANDPTGVLLTVESDATLDQLRITPSTAEETLSTLPVPGVPEPLDTTEVVPLLFPDALSGARVDLLVQGIAGGSVVAFGDGTVTLMRGETIPLTVVLSVPCGNGAIDVLEECDDRNREDGDGCSANCRVEEGWVCERVPSMCRASCPEGCPAGEHCVDDECVCDPDNCAGCCALDRCVAGDTRSTCGLSGQCVTCGAGETCEDGACAACADCLCGGIACDPLFADGCVDDTCRCGTDPPCAGGERCVTGACVCAEGTCDDGAGCEPADALATCGPSGGACLGCDPESADQCVDGECRCGATAACGDGRCVEGECVCGERACGPGQVCRDGSCQCDPSACSGCCDGDRCRPGDVSRFCGADGASCARCTPSREDCVSGACVPF